MDKQPLRIIVMGYYGHLNAGDDLLQQAMSYIFQDHKLMFSSWFPGSLALNDCDLVVVGGGSIWPGFSIFQNAKKIAKVLKVPLFVMGISAKTHDESVKEGTQKLIDKASFFHVRDLATFDMFNQDPRVKSGVDLFWWLPWSFAKEERSNEVNSVALNLREWNSVKWSPKSIVAAVQKSGLNTRAFPLYFGSSTHDKNIAINDTQLLKGLGLEYVPDHWTYQPVMDSEMSIAMRYHAILISTRLEKPVIGFNYHPKVVSFFNDNDIPELCVSLEKPDELERAIENVRKNYTKYVSRFVEIKTRLEACGQKELEDCRLVLKSILPAEKPSLIKRSLRVVLNKL